MPIHKILNANSETKIIEFTVGEQSAGQRLDQFLGIHGKKVDQTFSRSLFQDLIKKKNVSVDGQFKKTGYRLSHNERIKVVLPDPVPIEVIPEYIDFTILFEDNDVIVLSKPPGLVVHPACGNYSGTLVNGLLYYSQDFRSASGKIRPGIVHRLDKDTSGIMVVAKNDNSLQSLVRQFKEKKVNKIYLALVHGRVADNAGRITTLLGRHPVNRKKMAVVDKNGKEAVTNWQVVKRLANDLVLLKVSIETGRTHQIRVHMASLGSPVVGDQTYGKNNKISKELGINRQLLHAYSLTFQHPDTNEKIKFKAPVPQDMLAALEKVDGADVLSLL